MREELNRLRRINMDSEEDMARLKSDVAKLNERLRSFAAEIETKEHELANMAELGNRRKQELLNVQQENDKLMGMLRNAVDLKDNTDAQKMIAEEKYVVSSGFEQENGPRDPAAPPRERQVQI